MLNIESDCGLDQSLCMNSWTDPVKDLDLNFSPCRYKRVIL